MKKKVEIVFNTCDAQIGYQMRRCVLGPESELVRKFLDVGLERVGCSFKSGQTAVFIEPRIDSGFPDIVLAEFDPRFFERWPIARNLLSCCELKMLTYLYSTGGADFNKVRTALRTTAVATIRSLELLIDAGLVDRDRDSRCWRPLPIAQTYGVKNLIAVEAKVRNNDDVLNQAALNCWFASESYALTPQKPRAEFVDRAREAGIGMVSMTRPDDFRRILRSRRLSLPSSYASWQFNEWIGRRVSIRGDIA